MDILIVKTTYMGNKNKILATFKCVIMQMPPICLKVYPSFKFVTNMHLKIREHSGRCRYVAWIRRHRYVPCMLITISSGQCI